MSSNSFLALITVIGLSTAAGCSSAGGAIGSSGGDTSGTSGYTGPTFDPGDTTGTDTYDGAMSFDGDKPWNVLMISLDTTRVEDLGRYSGLDTTPNLDALFDRSFVLDNHRSCSNWTFASTVCFMGGGSDLDQGFVPTSDRDTASAPDSLVQAAEVLGDAGWSSSLVTTNQFLSSRFNNAQGFDAEIELEPHAGTGADVTEEGLAALAELADSSEVWYMHVHYLDPHDPYDPPSEYLDGLDALDDISWDLSDHDTVRDLNEQWDTLDSSEQALIQEHLAVRYRGELSYVDAQIGALLDAAEADGLLENTLVVFWTDHGEQLGEHGRIGHDYDLYEELNRSVVSFYAPTLEPGSWDGPTSHGDVWPTILDILPWDFDEAGAASSFTGTPVGERADDDPRFGLKYTGDDQTVMFVEQEDQKLIVYWDGRAEYYDLAADGDELSDAFDAGDSTVQGLWSLLEPELEALEALYPEHPITDPGI